jgi:hypothetical protein
MLVKTTFDINTHQLVYAICDIKSHRCLMLTTSVTKAIKAGQCKSADKVKELLSKSN